MKNRQPRKQKIQRALIPGLILALTAPGLAGRGQETAKPIPTQVPGAIYQPLPESGYDLQNLILDLRPDYPTRMLYASATNEIAILKDGLTQLRFNAGKITKIEKVTVNGKSAMFTRDAEGILVACAPSKLGQKLSVAIKYRMRKADAPEAEQWDGWHWHEPQIDDPSRIGFWTSSQPDQVREWAVTWDHPGDLTRTETRTTVPVGWDVFGNGQRVSDKKSKDGKTHTVTWRMDKPHATYLTSLVSGPFDVQKDTWRGMPLYYAVPRGPKKPTSKDVGYDVFQLRNLDGGKSLAYTCMNTKAMLSLFSDTFGFKYPWPQYTQVFSYDHNGGMENVSSSIFGLFITNPRAGNHDSDWIIAHELGHQWFGDTVTCKEWGDTWLNEGFAVMCEFLWFEHYFGKNRLQRAMDGQRMSYLSESRDYQRPLSTNRYQKPTDMFDRHSYAKGALVLMSLRAYLGKERFYAGLKRYLNDHKHSSVTTDNFCAAMSKAAGIDLKPWFEQWVKKSGHPIIEWSWSWDEDKKQVVLHVKQVQKTDNGTPIYDIPAKVAFLSEQGKSHVERRAIHLKLADQEFRIFSATKPDAVVFDPDTDFLRQIVRQPWAQSEWPIVAKFAPNCVDRQTALNRMVAGKPSDEAIQQAVSLLSVDQGAEPIFSQTATLLGGNRESLRTFWESELKHENFGRRTIAVIALGGLPSNGHTTAQLQKMTGSNQPYNVVVNVVKSLSKLDFKESQALLLKLARTSTDRPIRAAALIEVAKNDPSAGADLMYASVQSSQPYAVRTAGFEALAATSVEDPRLIPILRKHLNSNDYYGLVFDALSVVRNRKIKELLPEMKALAQRIPFAKANVQAAIKQIETA